MNTHDENPNPDAGAKASDGHSEFWSLVVGQIFRGANVLRKTLKLDETWFRHVAATATSDVRRYFFYRVLDEVQKAAVALLRWNLYLSQPDKELIDIPEKEQMFRIVLEETDDEQKLRCRK